MAIISFDRDAVVDYVPEYGGNRDSENPCVVRLKYLPYSKVQAYSKAIALKARNLRDPERLANVSQEIQRRQFLDSVESISGYFVEDREVTDPVELYETADNALITEIIQAMESSQTLTEGQLKNSGRASGGTPS